MTGIICGWSGGGTAASGVHRGGPLWPGVGRSTHKHIILSFGCFLWSGRWNGWGACLGALQSAGLLRGYWLHPFNLICRAIPRWSS